METTSTAFFAPQALLTIPGPRASDRGLGVLTFPTRESWVQILSFCELHSLRNSLRSLFPSQRVGARSFLYSAGPQNNTHSECLHTMDVLPVRSAE